jgi:hypothetical protein
MSKKPLPSLAEAVANATTGVTKAWTSQRKKEERHSGARAYRYVSMNYGQMWVKDAADRIMEEAYNRVTANGTLLPAQARQVMYQARPLIKALTSRSWNDDYFTQKLLPDYIKENDLDWDVVYKDRGTFMEPHTRKTIPLGTVNVRNYLGGFGEPEFLNPEVTNPELETRGPDCRFGAVLGIEKEGFNGLFQQSQLLERFDIGLASIVGQSTTSARRLIDEMCGDHDMKLFFVHDFDVAGFEIIGTLRRDTRRYEFVNHIEIVEVGLRLSDVRRYNLEQFAEPAARKGRKSWMAVRHTLRSNGASDEECEFLRTRRVEINALSNAQLIEMIERKLREHRIEKIVPDDEMLAKAYRFFIEAKKLQDALEEFEQEYDDENEDDLPVPRGLRSKVKAVLKKSPHSSWDAVVARLAGRSDLDPDHAGDPDKAGDPEEDDASKKRLAQVQRKSKRLAGRQQRQIKGDKPRVTSAFALEQAVTDLMGPNFMKIGPSPSKLRLPTISPKPMASDVSRNKKRERLGPQKRPARSQRT